jgi:MSHA biogenesis protein MshI
MGLAHVVHRPGQRPLLTVCHYHSQSGVRHPAEEAPDVVPAFRLDDVPFVGVLYPEQYMLFPAEAPPVPPQDVARAIRWRIKDQLDFPVDAAVVEVFPMAPTSKVSNMVYVVAARAETIRQHVQWFTDGRMKLHAIDIMELALRNLMVRLEDDQDGTVLVQLRGSGGVVMIAHQQTLYLARRMDIGTSRLLDSLGGLSEVDSTTLADSFIVEELTLELQRTIDYYESHFGRSRPVSVHLCPMTVQFPGLEQVLGDKLGMRIKSLPLEQIVEFAKPFDHFDVARCLPAIGAALRTGDEGSAS